MQSFDVLILGAGIVGSACALECVRAGLRVGIVEAAVPGAGATAAGMGHVVVMDDSPAQLALSSYSKTVWEALLPSLPASVEYEKRGTVWVAADDEEMAEVYAKQATYLAAGIHSEVLDAHSLAAEEPNLREGLSGGLLVPDDAVIYPPAAAGFFLRSATEDGAVLLRGSAAISIEADGSGNRVRLENASNIRTEKVVVATGTEHNLVPHLPILKRKGHLVITDRYPGFVHHQLVELGYLKSAHKTTDDSVAFNIQPRRTGQLLIGSSRQYGDEEVAVSRHMLGAMLERAQAYMPGLANISAIRVWTGFRAATPDKLPLIGPAEQPGVYLAMGFEGLGITNAPGAARLTADHLLGRSFSIDPTPYLPARIREQEPAHA